uniref:Bacteriocin plantaricin ASM1 n=2 Tax=Lactiplantibacillus plantarum TaxID=1590 RepID=PASM1_LACPN|nr:glycocin F family RiPP peptide [Lactiplantibacillus plantarum]C7G1H4.1 RecName: Full=Bacteriocin plantaricin ASM1; Flags: Precursor [Lactiplantibacillus plantarum]AOF43525.1 AsmF [Lactiplantibacillus plantarum]BAH98036.1 bacteriocin A1 [Lactiplantibacillus plantarum]
MSKLVKTLTVDEISKIQTNGGKPAWCWYTLAMCGAGYDSGTCDYMYSHCFGVKHSSGGGGSYHC